MAGLTRRFAVIQETCRSDSVDMYFDEALWLRVLEFATLYQPSLQIEIVGHDGASVQRDDFLVAWNALDITDRHPPAQILVRDNQTLVLLIQTENWNRVGGPWPYHDSYTYALFSNEDLTERVMQFLCDAEASRGWDISTKVLGPTREVPFWKRLLRMLLN
ncbi:MAG: hypothetical protein HY243_14780 [Proteobacteria bacterium]|nr:hypothetical protein [Pseudomonadota bacterium]